LLKQVSAYCGEVYYEIREADKQPLASLYLQLQIWQLVAGKEGQKEIKCTLQASL
jgi:hypothetical protein